MQNYLKPVRGSARRGLALLAFATALVLPMHRANAQTLEVQGAWARATVPGQHATGAFMTLTAPEGATLLAVRTPVAGHASVHEMKTEDGVMKMRELANGLDLPAGKAVQLAPGAYHVMLMDLKVALRPNTSIPLTLVLKDARGASFEKDIRASVSLLPPQ